MTKKQRQLVAMYAARGLTGNEIGHMARVSAIEVKRYCKQEGVTLCRLPIGGSQAQRPPSDPDELRARWAVHIGPMKMRLREAILYDAA